MRLSKFIVGLDLAQETKYKTIYMCLLTILCYQNHLISLVVEKIVTCKTPPGDLHSRVSVLYDLTHRQPDGNALDVFSGIKQMVR
jgi:hypothetical protein